VKQGFAGLVWMGLVIAVILIAKASTGGPGSHRLLGKSGSSVSTPVQNPVDRALALRPGVQPREGVAAAILVDTSGSMKDTVAGPGRTKAKIEIARECLLDLASQTEAFAEAHADKTILLGIYEFSSRNGENCRRVVPIGRPDSRAAQDAVRRMIPNGNTPIGDAIIRAKQDLDATGLSRLHILVITDGESNQGYSLQDVVSGISRLPEDGRPAMYFIAFDVAASKFSAIRDAGGLVLSAGSEAELRDSMEYVLSGKILAEQPLTPGQAP
jgi:hypothetical protein